MSGAIRVAPHLFENNFYQVVMSVCHFAFQHMMNKHFPFLDHFEQEPYQSLMIWLVWKFIDINRMIWWYIFLYKQQFFTWSENSHTNPCSFPSLYLPQVIYQKSQLGLWLHQMLLVFLHLAKCNLYHLCQKTSFLHQIDKYHIVHRLIPCHQSLKWLNGTFWGGNKNDFVVLSTIVPILISTWLAISFDEYLFILTFTFAEMEQQGTYSWTYENLQLQSHCDSRLLVFNNLLM